MNALAVFAHPDDETLFFGGFLLKTRSWTWTLVSVTHSRESMRGEEFVKACESYGAKALMLGFEDVLEKDFDPECLADAVRPLMAERFDFVVTHNDRGEYEHQHHKSVSRCVRRFYPNCFRLGYNEPSDITIHLNTWEVGRKREILASCYPSQTQHWALRLFEITKEYLITPAFEDASFNNTFLGRNDFWNFRTDPYEIERLSYVASATLEAAQSRVIEIGCHEGALTRLIAPKLPAMVALDISSVAIGRAMAIGLPNVSFLEFDINKRLDDLMQLVDGQHTVVCAEVMYYIVDRRLFMSELGKRQCVLITQHTARFHNLIELELEELGWRVSKSARSNRFGLGVYLSPTLESPTEDAGKRK